MSAQLERHISIIIFYNSFEAISDTDIRLEWIDYFWTFVQSADLNITFAPAQPGCKRMEFIELDCQVSNLDILEQNPWQELEWEGL